MEYCKRKGSFGCSSIGGERDNNNDNSAPKARVSRIENQNKLESVVSMVKLYPRMKATVACVGRKISTEANATKSMAQHHHQSRVAVTVSVAIQWQVRGAQQACHWSELRSVALDAIDWVLQLQY